MTQAGTKTQPLHSLCTDFKQDIVDGPFGSELKREDYRQEGTPVLKIQNVKPFFIELKKMDYITPSKFEYLKRHSYKNGDIIMTKLGDPLGVSAIVEDLDEGVIVADLVRIRAQKINTKYLCYHLNSPTTNDFINSMQKGTTRPRVTLSVVRDLPIYVPSDTEQIRIVTLLDEAFADIATAKANAEKNIQNARELFESYLDEVLGSQAGDHIATTLGTEVDLVAGFAFSSSRYSNNENDIRLLRGDNIMQGYLRWEDVKRWPMSDRAAYEKFALKEGDVVLAMDRPWVKAGLKRAQITATDLPCLQVQRTARLRPKQNLSADFLFHLTGSQAFSRHLLDVQTGIGVPHISGAQIQDFKFMRPPLAKQAMIATELQNLQKETQRLEAIYRQKLTALDDLKKSLLHQAFSGSFDRVND